jgi:hypothetical protein
MISGLLCGVLLVALKKLRNVLSLPDASTKLLRFVSDDIWSSRGRCRVISRSTAEYLVQAWDVRNSCKHNGAVLFLLVTRGGVTLLAGHTHQPDESDCGGLQHCCH